MVNRDFELLNELVSGRSSRLLEDLASLPGADQTAFAELVGALVRDVETSRATLLSSDLDLDDPLEGAVVKRELERYGNTLNVVHEIISVYSPDFERRLPVGLMHLVFATLHDVVERPLGIKVDPIVHLDPENNYSVQNLAEELAPFFPASESAQLSSETESVDAEVAPLASQVSDAKKTLGMPLLMNIPMLDPGNAFLAPIFAHEVAHVAADRSLVDELSKIISDDELDRLYSEYVGEDVDVQRYKRAAETRLNEWFVEELCDAVACLIAGPAFLYAEGSFLPAPKPATFNDHPSAQERIRWALVFLNKLGWAEWLREKTPSCLDYFEDIARRPNSTATPEVPYASYVRAAVEANIESVLLVAQSMLGKWLTPADFVEQDLAHELCVSLSAGLMPSGLGQRPPTLWHVLLAGWASWLGDRDTPAAVAEAVSDADLNRFLIKTLELVGISQLWGAYGTPSA